MTQELGQHPEQHANTPNLPTPHESVGQPEQMGTPEKPDELQASMDALRQRIETQAVSSQETSYAETNETASGSDQPHVLHQQLKSESYKRTLSKIQSHLSPAERLESKIIHQPLIDNASTIAGKTIGRPSGLLAGGVFSLAGTVFVIYMTKHFGFQYNYSFFLLLFVAGFFVGLCIELVLKLIRRNKSLD